MCFKSLFHLFINITISDYYNTIITNAALANKYRKAYHPEKNVRRSKQYFLSRTNTSAEPSSNLLYYETYQFANNNRFLLTFLFFNAVNANSVAGSGRPPLTKNVPVFCISFLLDNVRPFTSFTWKVRVRTFKFFRIISFSLPMYERRADVCDSQPLRVGNPRYLPVNFLKITLILYRGEFPLFFDAISKKYDNDDVCLLIFNGCTKHVISRDTRIRLTPIVT